MDPKVAAGGVVALGGSVGAGYAITKSVSSSETSETDTVVKKPAQKIKEKLGKSGFKLLSFDEAKVSAKDTEIWTNKWKPVATNFVAEGDKSNEEKILEKAKELLGTCKTLVEEDYEISKYKKAVKECVELTTFEARLGQLSIEKIKETPDTNLTTRWTLIESDFEGMKSKSIAVITSVTGTEGKEKIKQFCQALKVVNVHTSTTGTGKNSFEEEWSNYLKVCTQTPPTSSDFWTAVVTTGNK